MLGVSLWPLFDLLSPAFVWVLVMLVRGCLLFLRHPPLLQRERRQVLHSPLPSFFAPPLPPTDANPSPYRPSTKQPKPKLMPWLKRPRLPLNCSLRTSGLIFTTRGPSLHIWGVGSSTLPCSTYSRWTPGSPGGFGGLHLESTRIPQK